MFVCVSANYNVYVVGKRVYGREKFGIITRCGLQILLLLLRRKNTGKIERIKGDEERANGSILKQSDTVWTFC